MTEAGKMPYRPRTCVWELTLACNLRCGHCGSAAGRPRHGELTTAECLDVVDQLADLECRLITLSGGEPTLRPDWEQIAAAAIARGIVVNMVTNGVTMTPELARRAAGVGLANVGVSLDGTEPVHDSLRGDGSFGRARAALENLAAAGLSTVVLTHLNRATAPLLEELCGLAVELGARTWRTQLGKPMGRLARRHTLQPRDLLDVIPRLAHLKKISPIEVAVGDSIGYFGPAEPVLRPRNGDAARGLWAGCQAGRLAIGIESDGGVKGCLSLQAGLAGVADSFREGDLHMRRLEQIWFDDAAFAFNRRQTTASLDGACRTCEHAALCRGGAKCVAAAFTGRLGGDPYCYHRVARLQARRGRTGARSPGMERLRRAAMASLLGLGLGAAGLGCGQRAAPPSDAGTGEAVVHKDSRIDARKPDTRVIPCICPDYGVGIPCTCTDPCANACCDCEYGVQPPAECCP